MFDFGNVRTFEIVDRYFLLIHPILLLFCRVLGYNAKSGQSAMVFAGVFIIVWVGSAIVTINAQLLGGNMQVFQKQIQPDLI